MTALAASAPTTRPLSSRLMWALLAIVLLADALDVIDSTVTNIAAPTIATELHGGQGLIKWLGASYMLAMGVLLVVGGRLGDRFGQRRLFLVGMAGFTAASAVAGLSMDPALLIVARVAQGAFGALLIPQGMAIMTKSFTPEMLTKAFSLFAPLLGVAGIGGPVLAGFILTADLFGLTWRPIFLINVVLGGIGLVVAAKILPRDAGDRSTVVDGWGSGLLGAAMLGLLYGLVEGSTNGWTTIPILAGLAFFAAFGRRQSTAAQPLLKPSMLRNRGFTSGLLVGLALFAATTGLIYVLSLFLQEGLHASPRGAALALLPLTLGVMTSAFSAMGGLAAKLGRTLSFIGLTVVLIGCGWVLALVGVSGSELGLWPLTPAFFVIGLGAGWCYSTIFTVALGDVSPEEAGTASGSISSIQQLASAIGSAGVTSIFFHNAASGLDHAVKICLVVVLALVTLSLPLVAMLPRNAPQETP
jgi:EmrB/QacA subfamily drug resistance transporter